MVTTGATKQCSLHEERSFAEKAEEHKEQCQKKKKQPNTPPKIQQQKVKRQNDKLVRIDLSQKLVQTVLKALRQ